MLTHKAIWRGIDMLAAKNQLSASGLAKRAGLDPTTFNKSKRTTKQGKPRWPSTESLSKILDATQTTMGEFVALLDDGAAANGEGVGRRVRCVRLSQAEKEDAFDAAGFARPAGSWEDIELPTFSESALYAIEIDRDVAPPMLRAGDVVVISPESSVRRHDKIIVRLRRRRDRVRHLPAQDRPAPLARQLQQQRRGPGDRDRRRCLAGHGSSASAPSNRICWS